MNHKETGDVARFSIVWQWYDSKFGPIPSFGTSTGVTQIWYNPSAAPSLAKPWPRFPIFFQDNRYYVLQSTISGTNRVRFARQIINQNLRRFGCGMEDAG
ncbi:hypothetical protein RRF57_010204 [Xylaria bambusicola]|uniref:Uncharacterized protein n=1 Tax=Xylaria bambusicola TaxID=326684 RepID=A0AAN7ZCI6_9PEZI